MKRHQQNECLRFEARIGFMNRISVSGLRHLLMMGKKMKT